MKLAWSRLEEIIVAKARMASLAMAVAKSIRDGSGARDVSFDALVRIRECEARGNTALTILAALREAEGLAKSPLDRLVWCCEGCHSIYPAIFPYTPAALYPPKGKCDCCECGKKATAMSLSEALDTWPEERDSDDPNGSDL